MRLPPPLSPRSAGGGRGSVVGDLDAWVRREPRVCAICATLAVGPDPGRDGTCRMGLSLSVHSEQAPGPRHALQLVLASVFELDARTGDEKGDRR